MENTHTRVAQLLTQITGGRKTIAPHQYLVEDLGLDSLKMVDLMLHLEERLDVAIPIAEASRIRTVADLHAAVMRMRQPCSDLPDTAARELLEALDSGAENL